jgi:type II secretory pathway component PulJ
MCYALLALQVSSTSARLQELEAALEQQVALLRADIKQALALHGNAIKRDAAAAAQAKYVSRPAAHVHMSSLGIVHQH